MKDSLDQDVATIESQLTAERERTRLLTERLADYEQDARRVLAEQCAPDEKHCACVPTLRAANKKLRRALEEIRNCMGGDDASSGWSAPEDVWGIADAAVADKEKDNG